MKSLVARTMVLVLLTGTAHAQDNNSKPAPDAADVKYGDHARNVFDVWTPKGEGPFPLVLYIHGGGFRGGDKRTLMPCGSISSGRPDGRWLR